MLTTRLLSQGRGIKTKVATALKKLYVWHQYLVIPYNTTVSRIISDALAIDKAIAYFSENLGMRFARHHPSSVQADGHGGRSMLTK